MAIKGTSSKAIITELLLRAFKDKAFVNDKKIYVNMREGGEDVQVCIALTCPKTSLAHDIIKESDVPFDIGQSDNFTPEEIAQIEQLLKRIEM